MTCVECKRPMRCGRGARIEDHPGTVQHFGRGLCATCWERAQKAGTLADYPSTLRRWDELAEDYVILRGEGYTIDVIAERLGMTLKALDKALQRHRDDPRARRPVPRVPSYDPASQHRDRDAWGRFVPAGEVA